mgnify:CR=1 FL=1
MSLSEFKAMDELIKDFFEQPVCPKAAYCDYIASLIQSNLKANDTEKLLSNVGRTQLDLSPTGSFVSTKKTIEVEDRNGKKYRITVEEA